MKKSMIWMRLDVLTAHCTFSANQQNHSRRFVMANVLFTRTAESEKQVLAVSVQLLQLRTSLSIFCLKNDAKRNLQT